MDEAILQYIKRKHNLAIGERTAELIKTTIGNVMPEEPFETMDIKGRDLVSGVPKTLTITADEIQSAIASRLSEADVFITSGGAWGSEHDLMLEVVEKMGWRGIYRRVRMGPGKPVGFGLLEQKPFFILPGGPPSNEMAFLQLALPAIMKMKGEAAFSFPRGRAQLAETVRGHKDWTQFIHARLEADKHELIVTPAKLKSRLVSMARKDALIIIPEGWEELTAGESIEIQILKSDFVSG